MTTNYPIFFVAIIFEVNIIFELQIPSICGPSICENISNVTDLIDFVLAAINMFQGHTSIKNIKRKILNQFFLLHTLTKLKLNKIIRGMNLNKTCQLRDIPTKIIKMNANIFANFICLHFSYCIDIVEFPQVFKHADMIKRKKKVIKLIKDLLAYHRTFLNLQKTNLLSTV